MVFVGLGYEAMVRGCLDDSTQEAANVSCCHSGGMCDGGEKGVSVGVGGRNDAGSQGGVVKQLATFWTL